MAGLGVNRLRPVARLRWAGMEGPDRAAESESKDSSRFRCPYCGSYDIARLFIATVRLDSCECSACGARWDEEAGTGQYRGRSSRSSVLLPRDP